MRCEQLQKFGEHEQVSTRLNFASKSSKSKILRAVKNFHGPFITPNGNRTEWSPIQSVIIQVINKIGQSRSRGLICLITSMITDQIGWCEVLVPIIITATKFVIFYAFFKIQTRNFESFFLLAVKKSHLSTCVGWRVLSKPRAWKPYPVQWHLPIYAK